jgi:transposase InsO family protein
MAIDDDDLLDCFIHLPAQQGIPFQMDFQTISDAQLQDAALLQEAQVNPGKFSQQMLAPNIQVYCYTPQPGGAWKIYLPTGLLNDTVRWYHLSLGHIGVSRLADTLRMHFYHPRLQEVCEREIKRCDPCQRLKNVGRGHGETATREASLLPWQDVAVDLIGPWTLSIGNKKLKFHALTIIDMVTNLVEIVRIDKKTAAHVAMHFENTWLSRYPRPLNCIHDQGGEFIGYEFREMLDEHHINDRPTSAKNPQANSVCERMHQAIGNTLRILSTMDPPRGSTNAKQLVDTAIADAVYATRCTYNSALKTTPGGLAFGRDMILNIPLITDLEQLQKRRQRLIDQRLIAANTKRFSYDYQIGDEVLKLVYKPNKLEPRAVGPYPIQRVHANGTLTIQLNPGVVERISLRRVKPYHR